MPIGVITSEQFDLELTRNNSSVQVLNRGRGNVKEIGETVRALIAEEAINGAPVSEIQRALNISPSSISAYKNGATSTASYNTPNEKLKNHIDAVKGKIAKKAKNRLLQALNGIDSDKIADADLRTLSGVAKDMAVVIEKMEPKVINESNGATMHLHLYAPKAKEVNDYEIIDVTE